MVRISDLMPDIVVLISAMSMFIMRGFYQIGRSPQRWGRRSDRFALRFDRTGWVGLLEWLGHPNQNWMIHPVAVRLFEPLEHQTGCFGPARIVVPGGLEWGVEQGRQEGQVTTSNSAVMKARPW